jgi:ubiquitin-protein ligase
VMEEMRHETPRGAAGGESAQAFAPALALRVRTMAGAEFDLPAVPPQATAAEIVAQLEQQGVVPAPPAAQAYELALGEGAGFRRLDGGQSLEAAGVPSGATLLLVSNAPGAALAAIRAERLWGDHEEMTRIRGALLEWAGDGRTPPASYVVTYHLPSYLDAAFAERAQHRVQFDLPPAYPDVRPAVRMLDRPPAFHPNVFPDGRICLGDSWNPTEGLGFVVLRVAKMLLYYPGVTGVDRPANLAAAAWYRQHRTAGSRFPLLPRLAFPDPLTGVPGGRPPFVVRVVSLGKGS